MFRYFQAHLKYIPIIPFLNAEHLNLSQIVHKTWFISLHQKCRKTLDTFALNILFSLFAYKTLETLRRNYTFSLIAAL